MEKQIIKLLILERQIMVRVVRTYLFIFTNNNGVVCAQHMLQLLLVVVDIMTVKLSSSFLK